uniref:Retrotransposon gag domain-containing protein n=1 Tax=Brassica oleracea var. oleracea TaxID=109376 RepID=A0A0D3E8S3_BRAOL
MSTRSNKEIGLLLVEPLDLERVIHKSKRAVDTLQAAIGSVEIQASIDTIHPTSIDTIRPTSIDTFGTVHLGTVHRSSIDTVHQPSIDTFHPPSINTVHRNTVYRDPVHRRTVHHGTVHQGIVHPMIDTTCVETEKVEVLILKVDENEMLRDEEGQDPFQGLLCEDPKNHIEELEDLVSRSEQNEISVDHILCKIFPYSLSGDLFCWFRQLQLGSLTWWEDITSAFFNKFIYEAAANLGIEMRSMLRYMVEDDEQYGSGELIRVDKADISDPTSASIDGMTSASTDGTTSASTDGKTSTSINSTTSTLTNATTSTSIDDSTQKSTDVSSCDLVPDVDREITMEDFLELEDEAQPDNLDHNLQKKLDDHQHTSEKDLDTSPEASIDRQHPPDIERYPPDCIDRHQPVEEELIEERTYMSKASHLAVPKHQRPPIWTEEAVEFHKRVKRIHDPVKIVVPCAVSEVEFPIPPDKGAHLNSYIEVLDDHQHIEASQRGLRFRDEVDKGLAEAASIDSDQIPSNDTTYAISNDMNKPASIDATTSPSIDTGHVSEQKEFNVCGNLFDGETTTRSDKSGGTKGRNWKKRKRTKGGSQLSLIPHFSDGVRKSRVRRRCFSKQFAKVRALLNVEMIDKGEESMEEAFTQE